MNLNSKKILKSIQLQNESFLLSKKTLENDRKTCLKAYKGACICRFRAKKQVFVYF